MGRSPCCSKEGMNRGAWTALEDKILKDYIKIHGEGRWRNLPKKAGHRTATSSHNPLSQPKEKKDSKTRPSTEAPPLPMMDSSVIRTKALRCTKVFLPPQPHKIEHDLDNSSNIEVGPSMFGDIVEDKAVGLMGPIPSFVAEEDNSLDFMMDLNIEELCLYNFFDPDFSQLCDHDFDNAKGKNSDIDENSDLSPSFDQPLLFSEEMMEDWTRGDCDRLNITSDLRSLASLLDLEEDGLGE
ncbi:hypothetical protein HHK36_005918 [Tetracentron sinense]|uniref:Uncharacterized protein n=1 Tax=Tetracentron sinense TaxID=13715 RepID=A0A834ZHN1_TETSI|nr:hypothetical protein HHK36_005918 [Tetracentron sinense]